MNCSPPGFSVHGISQAGILEWVASSFSRGSSWLRDRTHISSPGRWILYHWATWEALFSIYHSLILSFKAAKGLYQNQLHFNIIRNSNILALDWQRSRWHPTPVLLPGKSHEWRSLVGCSPWIWKSRTQLSDFTFTFHFHALGKEMATHSSVLAWRIPGTAEPGELPSMGSHRVGHDWSDLAAAAAAALDWLWFT